MSEQGVDLVNRDPNDINDHVKVAFEDILAEPDGAHSINCVWTNSYKCFNCCKSCCYNLLTILCGLPLAMCWGCEFACITFHHVWHVAPCMRSFMIQMGCCQKFYGACIKCYYQPYYETVSYIFSNIRVTEVKG